MPDPHGIPAHGLPVRQEVRGPHHTDHPGTARGDIPGPLPHHRLGPGPQRLRQGRERERDTILGWAEFVGPLIGPNVIGLLFGGGVARREAAEAAVAPRPPSGGAAPPPSPLSLSLL